jgi:hypothetical protein
MACEFCKETNCAISKRIPVTIGGVEVEAFARVRFDIENNQIDMELGVAKAAKSEEDRNSVVYAHDWSDSIDIIKCPVCGETLKPVEGAVPVPATAATGRSIGGEMVKRMFMKAMEE